MLYTIKEVAEFLNMNPKRVRQFISAGRLNAIKFGRIYRVEKDDLNNFITENKTIKR
tara:strand:- start:467 stop:637 length:171 start_codon:yes stop_codon:yes gene_type:complete